ncbi:MAG: RagB/SusD family nutrient uptake outer membrane protein [Gemmatimonadota bacterium]|nr:RagB/SusD family nutrient uptake outer membrane protein [Gemmatimonadota bacterium]
MRNSICTACCAVLVLAVAAGCDTNVSNPGPVEDRFLSGENIYAGASALVNGAGRAVASGMNWVGYTGAAITREIHPAGSTGSFGITNRWQNGELSADDGDLDDHWELAQRGRWMAEEAVRRLVAAGPPQAGDAISVTQYNSFLQLAYLYAGFANRLLGENMCEAVFDGGPAEANRAYFLRAEEHFTNAIAISGATAQLNAAYAGRAAVRVFLDSWSDAVADAGRVPVGFTFNMPYYDVGEDAQRNRIAWASFNQPYRAHTQWSTWHHDYRQATNDPRVPITITTLQGDAAIECCGRVAWYPQAKYPNSATPIRLTSGREMRLIEAEAHLRNSDATSAMTSIDQVRTAAGAGTITAADLTDAWRLLKRERGIELWLEARRMGDRRRWAAASTPGGLDPLEIPGPSSHLARQDLCFPISRSERETNPNLH